MLSYITITRPLIYFPCFLQAAHAAAINVTSVATTLLTRKLKVTGSHKYKRILSFLFIAVFSSILSIVITDVILRKQDTTKFYTFKHNLSHFNLVLAMDVFVFKSALPVFNVFEKIFRRRNSFYSLGMVIELFRISVGQSVNAIGTWRLLCPCTSRDVGSPLGMKLNRHLPTRPARSRHSRSSDEIVRLILSRRALK